MPMNKKQAAAFLGVTIRSIEGYATKGKLTPAKAKGERGDITVYDESELEKLKAEREQIVFVERPESQALTPVEQSPGTALEIRREIDETRQALLAYLHGQKSQSQASVGEKVMLRLADAAALSSLSENHLREAIKAGKLKGRIIGRGYKIKRPDLDLYIKKL
jgi:excisionase family DNA binding protein